MLILLTFMCSSVTVEAASRKPTATPCARQMFLCRRTPQCINDSLVCNGKDDCIDGTDENVCEDIHQNEIWNRRFIKRPDSDRESLSDICSLRVTIAGCVCKDRTKLYCKGAGFGSFPLGIPKDVTSLYLENNRISHIESEVFTNLTKLQTLDLSWNLFTVIKKDTFRKLKNLRKLLLIGNRLEVIENDAFSRNNKLQKLYLSNNALTSLHNKVFSEENSIQHLSLTRNDIQDIQPVFFEKLKHMTELDLSINYITHLQGGIFDKLSSLAILKLMRNRIERIEGHVFKNLKNLSMLYLEGNRIAYIEDEAFVNLTELQTLTLSDNRLEYLTRRMFRSLDGLRDLHLRENRISHIEPGTFDCLGNLKALDLQRNALSEISSTVFQRTSVEFIYFDTFFLCSSVPSNITCHPEGDGISSHADLLDNIVLRVCVWIMGILASVGNLLVFLGRFVMKEDNQIHSFFIKNLSFADFLMGIYLLVIGSRDLMYRGQYILYDSQWRNSWECDTCGVLSTLSSEVSVMTLTLITMDRYISIQYPLSFRHRNIKHAVVFMALIWGACFTMSALPVFNIDYFGKTFYRNNAVCIPFHFHEAKEKGWEYSAVIFIGVNSISFIFIAYAYAAMFYTIRQSTGQIRSSCTLHDKCLVIRFFFIIITDFLCWIPIIIIKIAVLLGAKVSGSLYAWVVVFILPVNSALNPLLYTLTTKLFKQKLIPKVCAIVFQRTLSRENYSWSRGDASRRQPQDSEMESLRLKERLPSFGKSKKMSRASLLLETRYDKTLNGSKPPRI